MSGSASSPAPRRLLVVATAPCSDAAADAIADAATGVDEVLVVCPAPASALNYWANDRKARDRAQDRLAATLDLLAARGIDAAGEVGDDDPLQALDDAVVIHRPTAALLVTPTAGSTGWLERGVVAAARQRFPFPIDHVALDDAGRVTEDAAALISVDRRHPARDAATVAILAFLAALGSAFWFIGPAVGSVPEWGLVAWAVFFDVVPKCAFAYAIWRLYLGRRFGDRIAAPVGR